MHTGRQRFRALLKLMVKSAYEGAFNSIEELLRPEDGIANELDYVEQSTWVLFLKYLHDFELEIRARAKLAGKRYVPMIVGKYRWDRWAAPKSKGELDHKAMLVGADLIAFVNGELFPYLAAFKSKADNPRTTQYKIGEIFSEIRNKFRSGTSLRDVLEIVEKLSFNSQDQRHELSQLYETRIRRMGNAGRNGGEYYTPRPLIRAMVKVIDPKIGETIYDGASGSAGFLCEAYEYLRHGTLSAAKYTRLQSETFFGQEKKSLAYIIGIMNMILHGIEAPNVVHANSLNENLRDIQEKDRHDVILANPPFGGNERKEVQQNFTIRTRETAYLFLQHFIAKLRTGGRAAIVIKNTFLSNADNASVSLRRHILEYCDLHSVLICPQGTFLGAGVKTVVLFFRKGSGTRKIWFYELDAGRNLGKTNPLNDQDLEEFVKMQSSFAIGPQSWCIERADIDQSTLELSTLNPHVRSEVIQRTPLAIIDETLRNISESASILNELKKDI